MDLQELRQEAIKIIKANPELKSEIQDLFSLAISEVEEGGSESHECDLAYNDMIELQNEANNNKMVKGGKLTESQQAKFDKVMSEWKAGKLHSGSSDGPIVTDQDQAIAIAYAQANAMKKMEFGGLVYDSLSDEAKDRMDGLVPTEQINNVLSNCRYIVSQMMEEGFELDEAISFIVYKIVDDFTDKRTGYFSDEYYPEDWKSKPDKPKVLVKLYNALSKADNLDYLSMEYDQDEGYYIDYTSGLESESEYHKGEIESYAFYVDEDNDGLIESVYDLNGHSATGLTIDEVLSAVRANNKMDQGGSVEDNEIEEYAEAIYQDLRQEYKPYELQNMSMEEAMMSVDSYDDVPENLKEEVASYLMNMASQNEFFEEDMYNKGGVIENKMQSLENELNRLESELKWTQQQNGASKQYYLRKRRSGKMTRERAMELIDQSNASWKKEREKVREKIKEVKDRIKRLEELSSKINADQFAKGGGVEDLDYGFKPKDLLDEMIKTPWGVGRIYEVAGKGSNQHVKIDVDGKTYLMNMGEINIADIVKYADGGSLDKAMETSQLSSKDQKALVYFCDRVSEEINDEYGDDPEFNSDEYTSEAMMEYFLDHIDTNDMTVNELIDDYNWREFTFELGLGHFARGGKMENGGGIKHSYEITQEGNEFIVEFLKSNGELDWGRGGFSSREEAEKYALENRRYAKGGSMYANGGVVEEDAYSINTIALMNDVRKSENTFQEFKRKLTQIIERNGYRMPTAKAFEIAYEKNSFAKGGIVDGDQ